MSQRNRPGKHGERNLPSSRVCALPTCDKPTRPVMNYDIYVCEGEHIVTGIQVHNFIQHGTPIAPHSSLPNGAQLGEWTD